MAFYSGTWTDTFEVKKDAGMEDNPRISEERDVAIHVKAAEAELESAIAIRYSLPLSSNTYYTGSKAESLLEEIAKMLASGLLMMRQYKGQGGSLENDAKSKIEYARDMINRITGISQPKILLVGTDGSEISTIDSGKMSITGFPNNVDDEDDPDDNENAKFTMDMKF